MLIPLSNKQHSILMSILVGSPLWMKSGLSLGSGQDGCFVKLGAPHSRAAVIKALQAAAMVGWPQRSLDAILSKLPA